MYIFSKIKACKLLFMRSDKAKFLFFLVIPGVLFAGMFFYSSFAQYSSQYSNLKENDLLEKEPVLLSGNTLMVLSNLPNPGPKIVKKMPVIVTAYSSTPWETWGDPFITAAGTRVQDGIIANNLLPFGTKVRMPEIYGDRIFVVEDRMNSRKGNYHFDVWFSSHSEALNFGVKKTFIEVLEN